MVKGPCRHQVAIAAAMVVIGGLLLTVTILAVRYPLPASLLIHPDVLEVTLVPEHLSTVPDYSSVPLNDVEVYGLRLGIPCEPGRAPYFVDEMAVIKCANENAITINDPSQWPMLPWVGDSPLHRQVHQYMTHRVGAEDPYAILREWLRMTPEKIPWATALRRPREISFLLRMKYFHLTGHDHIYELPDEIGGFQLGTLPGDTMVGLLLFEPGIGVVKLVLGGREEAMFSQRHSLALARSLRRAEGSIP